MKKTFLNNIILALSLVAIICGCEGSPADNPGGSGGESTPSEYLWHFKVGNAGASQVLGVFVRDFDGGITNGEYHLDAATGASFEIKTDFALSTGGKIYAYAPYNAANTDHKAVRMTIPEEQTAGEDVMPRASVPLVLNDPKPDSTITLQMLDLASVLSVKVYSTKDTGEKITGLSFTSGNPLAGSFTFSIKDIDANQGATLALSGYAASTVKVSCSVDAGTDPGAAAGIPLVVAPGAYTGIITVFTDKDQYGIVVEDPLVLTRAETVPLTVRIAPRISQDEGGSTEDFAGGELETE